MRFSLRSKASIVLTLSAFVALIGAFAISGASQSRAVDAAGSSFISRFHTVTRISSTVPHNGDVNPYGVAVVPTSIGHLVRGDILVSNFNNKANLQGTGTTIVEISPHGQLFLFARIQRDLRGCPGGVGLTTALVVLKRGWVIVGSLPTKDGSSATAQAGCLIVLDSRGKVAETFSGQHINGPWDMTALDQGKDASLFVTNVLNGTVAAGGNVVNKGTVIRINIFVPKLGWGKAPARLGTTVIGSGFSEKTDPAALVIGPTGVGLGSHDILYVADTVNNRIAAIPFALTRKTTAYAGRDVTANGAVNGPLGLAIAPNGDILTVNSNDGNIVETTPRGQQFPPFTLDTTPPVPTGGAGTLFGLAVAPHGKGIYFVDDGSNTLNLFH
jgi:hypothetical protein